MIHKINQGELSNDLNLIADVNNEGVRSRFNGDPFVVASDLEARNIRVGQEKGHPARIRMRGKAEGEIRLRAFRVEIDP